MTERNIYGDIATRTDGNIYIGVVGPVRTGKSTFIKRFMELLVLPNIEEAHRRERAMDALPVSGAGRTIMTTQPKFVPDEAVEVRLRDQAALNVRLVDCVGYLIDGVLGTQEDDSARMVRTPWFDHDIPFEEAAELGTRRVIAEHSTLGLVVTTDGTVADLPRAAYAAAEERVVRELKALGKPFIVLLNSREPESEKARNLQEALSAKYDVPVRLMSVENMTLEDIRAILEDVLFEFPVREVWVETPRWLEALGPEHWLNAEAEAAVREAAGRMRRVRDHGAVAEAFAGGHFSGVQTKKIRLSEGAIECALVPAEGLFYQILSEESGENVTGEEHLMTLMCQLVKAKREYDRVAGALSAARETGYGQVLPEQGEMALEKPEIVQAGGRYGVRLKASAPSLHLFRVDTQTEVSPVVGAEKQSRELAEHLMTQLERDPESIWTTNMFGKSLGELVREGLAARLTRLPPDAAPKMREALAKIVNEGHGGMICILL
ncbi:MAG: stage IV sporulation protein A [Clostridia bacterium]|nr:stage IV sporulation protein A [Clostridia bacterium]